ncbi:MAG: PIN domain-containing protein [Blastocatellia bacterium]|nr:PIN domain-containing protein [Blastocatellia bacterium]
MKQLLLDTNVLVRFLVQDDAKQAAATIKLINDAQSGNYELLLDRMVVAELVYVLMSHYKRARVDVANTVLAIVRSPYVRVDQEPELVDSLLRFRDHGVDLVDAWLAAKGASSGLDVASFDRDLDKCPDVQRFEPKA